MPSIGQAVKMLEPLVDGPQPGDVRHRTWGRADDAGHALGRVSGSEGIGYFLAVSVWLWLTVWFANFAEAVAEARGGLRRPACARPGRTSPPIGSSIAIGQRTEDVPASELQNGDVVRVEAGETIPADGEVIEGVASVDESAITGESAPVIRESGGDRSAVTGGTRVLSDHLVIRVTARPGESFLDRMIAMVEGAERQKTPNEIALTDRPGRLHAGVPDGLHDAVSHCPVFRRHD